MYLAVLIGVFLLLFGLLLLIFPERIKSEFGRTIMVIDDAVISARKEAGTVLLIVSALMLWLTLPYPSLLAINIITAIAVFFGVLLIFFSDRLKKLSDLYDRFILAINELMFSSSKTLGVSLIILGVYIVCIALPIK